MKVIAVTKNPDKYNKDKANIVDYGNDDNRNYNNSKTDYFVDDIRGLQHLPESLSQADYISIHTPLTDETLEMISHDEISVMKKTAFLVNVARASIVDRGALFKALKRAPN